MRVPPALRGAPARAARPGPRRRAGRGERSCLQLLLMLAGTENMLSLAANVLVVHVLAVNVPFRVL